MFLALLVPHQLSRLGAGRDGGTDNEPFIEI